MSEMVDRVARAICGKRFLDSGTGDDGWDDLSEGMKEQRRDEARAAIAAMLEPTEAMLSQDTLGNDNRVHCDRIWGRMIDAALKESP